MNTNVTAVVLAAGKSERMGATQKLMLPFQDSTVLGTVLKQLQAAHVADIIVVLGHKHEEVLSEVPPGLTTIVHTDYAKGLTSSIQAGISAAAADTAGYLICLGDQPLVTTEMYNQILQCFQELEFPSIVVPCFAGKRGNPVLFPVRFKQQILDLAYPDGCRPLVKHQRFAVVELNVDHAGIIEDVDTPQDYQRLVTRPRTTGSEAD